MQERLQKIISAAGIASRRKAEELMLQGRVTVNGRAVTELGSKADAGRDHIKIDGKPLPRAGHRITLLLNKPVGVISTVSDPEGRKTVVSLVRGIKEKVYPVGRLDYYSSGLLLLTNDGELANFLMARASAVPRTYHVKLNERAEDSALAKLEQGIVLDGRRTAPCRIRPLARTAERGKSAEADKPWYEITLVEGRYHQVRRMFERIGRPVVKLKRVRIAFLTDRGLAPGRFRVLDAEEVRRLKNWKGTAPESRSRRDPEAGRKSMM
jgi:23S rRNA pseudouridine2605 synthase